MLDSKRGPTNLNANYIIANSTNGEADGSSFILGVDFLSNGFKCRGNNNINTGTGRYVYLAFAENLSEAQTYPLLTLDNYVLFRS